MGRGLRKGIAALVGESNMAFFRHARNYLSASAVAGILAFLTVAVLTRLLSPAEYGIVAIFLSIVSVFSILIELNFRGAVNRYYLELIDDFPDFLRTSLCFIALFTISCLGLLALFKTPLAQFFGIAPGIFLLGVACAAMQIPWNLNWKLLVAQQRSGTYAKLSVLRDSLIFAVGAVWVLVLAQSVGPSDLDNPMCVAPRLADGVEIGAGDGLICGRQMGVVYGTFCVALVFGALLAFRLARIAARGRFRRKHLVYALAFGVPLIPHALSGFLLVFFDRVIVNQLENEQSTGLYSFAYNIGMAMAMVVTAMNQAWLPIFTGDRREGRYGTIERLARSYSRYVYAIALLLVLFAREIAMVLADERYTAALTIVPVIVFSYVVVFLYTIYANHSFYLRKTWLISAATLIAAGTNVGLNYWLIPKYGYQAAAWTTLGCYLLLFVLHFLTARVLLAERVVRLRVVLPWFFAAAFVAAAYVLLEREMPGYWTTVLCLKLPILLLIGGWLYWTRPGRSKP